jgi:hypothetical protein
VGQNLLAAHYCSRQRPMRAAGFVAHDCAAACWHGAWHVSAHRSGYHALSARHGMAGGGATMAEVGRSSIHGGGATRRTSG